MDKSGDRSPPESIQRLLSGPIDPANPTFWVDFKKKLLISKPDPLDRRAIMNLKLMFNDVSAHPDRLSSVTQLLKLLKPTWRKADLASEIAFTLNSLLTKSDIPESETIDFIKTTSSLASSNPPLRHGLFEELVEPFAESLLTGIRLSHGILAALFELQIVMISQCPDNWPLVDQFLTGRHWSKCFALICENHDSLSQMLIAEWMWRINNRTKSKTQYLGEFEPLFNEITADNFRGPLHAFVRALNRETKAPLSGRVVHAEYSRMKLNSENARCSGWIDFNQDTVVVWLFDKSANLPDVVVLKTKHITDPIADPARIQFTTREKVTAFDKITSQRPLVFDFALGKTTKTVVAECQRRLLSRKPPGKLAEPRTRIFAERGSDVIARKTFKKAKSAADVLEEISTQDQELSVEQIERQIAEFHGRSTASIEELEARITKELQEIIGRVGEQKRTLVQFTQQHQQLVQATTAENGRVARAVAALEAEAEVRHGEVTKKREAISRAVLDEIAGLKQQFLGETDAAFARNAIVSLADTLGTLQETMA
jgi:hypothetical protein